MKKKITRAAIGCFCTFDVKGRLVIFLNAKVQRLVPTAHVVFMAVKFDDEFTYFTADGGTLSRIENKSVIVR